MNINLEILDAFFLVEKDEVKELNTKEIVPQMMFRRRLTRASKLIIELFAKLEDKEKRVVYGSSFGELLSSANILKSILNDDILSPTDFQNSVYNTAVSYASILFQNSLEISTISSGDDTSLKVLKVGAVKALDGDEIVLLCSETLNIPNIDEINSCIDFLECAVLLRVRISDKSKTIEFKDDLDSNVSKSISHMLSIAKKFDKTKLNIIEVEI